MKKLLLKTRNTTLLVIAFLTLSACSVTFVPSYNARISEQIEETTKQVDLFYLTMLETTTNKDESRAFNVFVQDYIAIEVELNALLNKNKIRPLNSNSTRICEITLELWQKYKGVHKADDNLSNGEIIINRKIFSDLFFAMLSAEEGKKLAENPPQ